jgi:peptide/nickel transport system permease protein
VRKKGVRPDPVTDLVRSAFPARAYLLWPPAIALTVLLVAIALVGDALRDFLDPKMD